MVSVKEISILGKTCVRARQTLDNIHNINLVLKMNMQARLGKLNEEIVYSTSLVMEARAKVASLQMKIASLMAGLPATAEALSIAEAQLKIATRNLNLMEKRLSLAHKIQINFNVFFKEVIDKLAIDTGQFGNSVDMLDTRINHAIHALDNYFSTPTIQGTIDFIKQKTQNFEYQKMLYSIGKATMQDIENAYMEKLKAKKDSFITSSKADELGIKISQYNMPEFKSIFEQRITIEHFDKERYVHDRIANKALKETIANNDELKKNFNSRQLQQIESGITPDGFTWHHDGNPPPGRMQLVDSYIHSSLRHTGGYSLWCERN